VGSQGAKVPRPTRTNSQIVAINNDKLAINSAMPLSCMIQVDETDGRVACNQKGTNTTIVNGMIIATRCAHGDDPLYA
jgi:hypothetical protein